MDEPKLEHEDKVKEISVANGRVYVDLLCGLRLSCPMLEVYPLDEAKGAPPPMEREPLH